MKIPPGSAVSSRRGGPGGRPRGTGGPIRLADVPLDFWPAAGAPEKTGVFSIPAELTAFAAPFAAWAAGRDEGGRPRSGG